MRFFFAALMLMLCCGLSRGISPSVGGPDNTAEWELSLAKDGRLYMLLDLNEKVLELRIRGIVLRSWEIRKARTWGAVSFDEPVSLVRKKAIAIPSRAKIRPKPKDDNGDEEVDTFEVEALEARDMPSRFRLQMDKGFSIFVRPEKGRGSGGLHRFFGRAAWMLKAPMRTVISAVTKAPQYRAVEIWLADAGEAQMLFWTLGEDMRFIVVYTPG